jgi:hypothetical protein
MPDSGWTGASQRCGFKSLLGQERLKGEEARILVDGDVLEVRMPDSWWTGASQSRIPGSGGTRKFER